MFGASTYLSIVTSSNHVIFLSIGLQQGKSQQTTQPPVIDGKGVIRLSVPAQLIISILPTAHLISVLNRGYRIIWMLWWLSLSVDNSYHLHISTYGFGE